MIEMEDMKVINAANECARQLQFSSASPYDVAVYAYSKGAECGYKAAIEKAGRFLWDCGYIDTFVIDEVIDKFKKYMEEQQ
jgi:hypothetical protein